MKIEEWANSSNYMKDMEAKRVEENARMHKDVVDHLSHELKDLKSNYKVLEASYRVNLPPFTINTTADDVVLVNKILTALSLRPNLALHVVKELTDNIWCSWEALQTDRAYTRTALVGSKMVLINALHDQTWSVMFSLTVTSKSPAIKAIEDTVYTNLTDAKEAVDSLLIQELNAILLS